jgi:hypothetical protein
MTMRLRSISHANVGFVGVRYSIITFCTHCIRVYVIIHDVFGLSLFSDEAHIHECLVATLYAILLLLMMISRIVSKHIYVTLAIRLDGISI